MIDNGQHQVMPPIPAARNALCGTDNDHAKYTASTSGTRIDSECGQRSGFTAISTSCDDGWWHSSRLTCARFTMRQVSGLFQCLQCLLGTGSAWPLSEVLLEPACDKALLRAVCSAAAHASLAGQSLFKDFISEREEAALLDLVDNHPPQWKNSNFNGAHR